MKTTTCDRCGKTETTPSKHTTKPDIVSMILGQAVQLRIPLSTNSESVDGFKEEKFISVERDLCGSCRSAVKLVMIEKLVATPVEIPRVCSVCERTLRTCICDPGDEEL